MKFWIATRYALLTLSLLCLFELYSYGIARNPPGFYLDESATAYHAWLVSKGGAGETGSRFPVLFKSFDIQNANYINPVTIYLMALMFKVVHPSVVAARTFATFWMFCACLLLGVLGKRLTGKLVVGIIIAAMALCTPWFFEVGRLVWDAHFSTFTMVVFLVVLYRAAHKQSWNWLDIVLLSGSLTLITYGYYSGRILGPLFALGLLLFATRKEGLLDVLSVWCLYVFTLWPLMIFNRTHPGELSRRLWEVTDMKPSATFWSNFDCFIKRYLEDQSLQLLLFTGDVHPRHHVPESGGPMLASTVAIACAGLFLLCQKHLNQPWWQFVLYGLAVSIVPGAVTNWPFHELRLMAYAVFLFLLCILALDELCVLCPVRFTILGFLLLGLLIQVMYFQEVFWREGPNREFVFDVPYKTAFDAALARPERPIYLENGQWGPAYIHAHWYAATQGQSQSQFVTVPAGQSAPRGALVLSSNSNCTNCKLINHFGAYVLYTVN